MQQEAPGYDEDSEEDVNGKAEQDVEQGSTGADAIDPEAAAVKTSHRSRKPRHGKEAETESQGFFL